MSYFSSLKLIGSCLTNYNDMIRLCLVAINWYDKTDREEFDFREDALQWMRESDTESQQRIYQHSEWSDSYYLKIFKATLRDSIDLSDVIVQFRLSLLTDQIKGHLAEGDFIEVEPLEKCEVCNYQAGESVFEREHTKKEKKYGLMCPKCGSINIDSI